MAIRDSSTQPDVGGFSRMTSSLTGTTMGAMSSYAVFWRSGGIALYGRLEFDPHGLWLHGGERGYELRVEVPYNEIVSAERAGDRIGPCPAIRIQTRAAGSLLIASIGGFGVLSEILARVHRNVGLLADAAELAKAPTCQA
jgi:hypothetical protein